VWIAGLFLMLLMTETRTAEVLTESQHYTLHTKLMSWRAAQTFCRQHYTDLASETTEAQHVNVYRSGQHKYVWIGLFRDSWTWSDQSTGSFRNWHKGMPDDAGGRQNCARIATAFKNQWDDVSCANKYPFVCNSEYFITYCC
uniref:C-type lectin domain-containing protein n=1 Tax=Stegastes partitus TaxID=144197 RepID=A0A3B5A924_9TELE